MVAVTLKPAEMNALASFLIKLTPQNAVKMSEKPQFAWEGGDCLSEESVGGLPSGEWRGNESWGGFEWVGEETEGGLGEGTF